MFVPFKYTELDQNSTLIDLENAPQIFRFICQVPKSAGKPPAEPTLEYIQNLIDTYASPHLRSDPSVNPNPVRIENPRWLTRFISRSAVADSFFTRLGGVGGPVFLVGDAAHIHPPAGGQGMNLGMRDAMGLARVVARHIVNGNSSTEFSDFEEFSTSRRARALQVVHLAEGILDGQDTLRNHPLKRVFKTLLWLLNFVPAFRAQLAWQMSGLASKEDR